MKPSIEWLASRPALIALLWVTLAVCHRLAPSLWPWDLWAYDLQLRWSSAMQPPASPRVIHLDIDPQVTSRWSSDREMLKSLGRGLERIQQQGAALIVVDLLLTGKKPEDLELLWHKLPRVVLARTLSEEYPDVPRPQGCVELPSDPDGITRRYRLQHASKPSLALAAYLQLLGAKPPEPGPLRLPTLAGDTRPHPEVLWVNQQSRWSTNHRRNLRHLTWQDVEKWSQSPPAPHSLEGCVVFVGQVGAGSVDLCRTPLDERFPRVGVHAWAFHDLLQQSWRCPAPAWVSLAFLAGALLTGSLATRWTLCLLALFSGAALALGAFLRQHWILPAASWWLLVLLSQRLELVRRSWLAGYRRRRWTSKNDPSDPWLHRELGDHLLVERVGRGGFATVYRALPKDTLEPGRAVAVKIIHESESQNPDFRRRFLREVRICQQLRHPHLVHLLNSGEQEGTLYLVMEFLQGQSLRELLESGNRPTRPFQLARQMLEGLAYAHKLLVQHRDLKPENLMLTPRGLKIVDFGLAQDARSSRITKTHELVGTLDYLAPERIQGVVSDPRSDQYSAGVILYEMLTGKTPYQRASSTAEALLWRLTRDPSPLAEQRPDLPAPVQAWVSKMLERDPEARYSSMDEVLEALSTLEKAGLVGA